MRIVLMVAGVFTLSCGRPAAPPPVAVAAAAPDLREITERLGRIEARLASLDARPAIAEPGVMATPPQPASPPVLDEFLREQEAWRRRVEEAITELRAAPREVRVPADPSPRLSSIEQQIAWLRQQLSPGLGSQVGGLEEVRVRQSRLEQTVANMEQRMFRLELQPR
ncbi:MAG: hypothetical protein ACRD96_06420 [Bryobacteraceae bacterium]